MPETSHAARFADWTPRQRPGRTRLQGRHVVLEPLDWQRWGRPLFAAVAGEENRDLWRYMSRGPFPSYDDFHEQLERERCEQGTELLVICDAASGDVLGMLGYMRIREAHGCVEIGHVAFGDRLKRTIHATETLFLVARHAFDDLGYRRCEWKCHAANEQSKRAAERFGFTFEGIFRNDMIMKGESRDTFWYSIIDKEWPYVRSALEAWLAPSNFDQRNRQIRRLEECRGGENISANR